MRIPELAASRVREKIKNGIYSAKLSHQQYLKHKQGSAQYEAYKNNRIAKGANPQSIIYVSEAEAQKIINDYAGTGLIRTDRNGNEMPVERITVNKIIGAYWGNNQYRQTNKVAIHYGKRNTHIVPIKGDDYD